MPPHLKHTALLELADSSTVGKVFDDGACFVVLEELATHVVSLGVALSTSFRDAKNALVFFSACTWRSAFVA